MMTFNPDELPRNYPRSFVPPQADLGDWEQIEPLLIQLERRPLDSVESLEGWLQNLSELGSTIGEEGAVRQIRMTCQTDDPELEKAYLHFIQEIEPRLKPYLHRLQQLYLASPARQGLDLERYRVWDRRTENAVALYHEENIPLQTEEQVLGQRYQKLTGAMTVEFDGRRQTLQQMTRYLEETDRPKRRQAWELVSERRLADRQALDELYDQLLALRQRIAHNAGFANYRDYAFRALERFDYTPEDCLRFHQAVEQSAVPLLRRFQAERADQLELESLRPWDLQVDPQGRPPLRPFDQAEELIAGCQAILRQVSPDFGKEFQQMADLGLLELESRVGKAPGGYQATLSEHRLPFIFMNAAGLDGDVRTLLHEAGHAFHTFAAREQFLGDYRHAPTEFSEVASISMELLGGEQLEAFYSPEAAARSRREHLERIANLLAWIATIDAFQHWLYTHPGHSPQERQAAWLELHRRFGGQESWQGYEEALGAVWQRQLHLYLVPFYYIEYGIAQLGALGIWNHWQQDHQAGLAAYRRALALGGSRSLPQLFEAAELPFDFGAATVATAIKGIEARLA
ncbi:MAG TPA: M3 family oligoendopeptidase [Candidatus Fraserbacteria bacterium]|nr:M3 family oligoendopeptidase [Candidatus Fraserbacteria bacterium]